MRSDWHRVLIRRVALYFLPAAVILFGLIDGFVSSMGFITPRIAVWGSVFAFLTWAALYVYTLKFGLPFSHDGKTYTAKRLGISYLIACAGFMAGFWIPVIAKSLKLDVRVELIPDPPSVLVDGQGKFLVRVVRVGGEAVDGPFTCEWDATPVTPYRGPSCKPLV